MKIHSVSQGSPEWLALRAGIPTASQFHRVITPKRGERSAQAEDYSNDLVAERFMGRPLATPEMPWMKDGLDREPEAAAYYALLRGVDVETVGFVTTDDGLIGCSPDRLVGDGLLEIKCPRAATHIGYLLGAGPDETYRVQLQGQLLVTERPWVDIISYYPGMPEAIVHIERDEPFIEKLRTLLYELIEQVDWKMRKLEAEGHVAQKVSPMFDPLGVTDEDIDLILAEVNQ